MNWQNFIQYLDLVDKQVYEYILVYADPEWLRVICHFIVKDRHIFPVLIIFFLVYGYKNPRMALILFLSTLLLLGISETSASLLKNYFGRHRPVYQMGIYISNGGFSFPSAHALNTMAFAVFWSSRFKPAAPWLYTFSLTIGTARVLSNFHFPGDVMAGWIAGYAVGTIFVFLYNSIESKYIKKITSA